MTVWIDLANSPHVLFFRPIIAELERSGHRVLITARDFAQTLPLCKKYHLPVVQIGGHGGKGLFSKARNISARSYALYRFAKQNFPVDLAISHNSYSHTIAAKLAGIPSVTIMDYEFQPANHLAFRLADAVFVPECFPGEELFRFGASGKSMMYPGIKEEVYLYAVRKDVQEQKRIETWLKEKVKEAGKKENVIALIRPPANMAVYHRFENELFPKLLCMLKEKKGVTSIILPRTPEQHKELEKVCGGNLVLADKVFDGVQLLLYADLVISAGGTMNREAAVLGTPAYSLFAGKRCAVDTFLEKEGKLQFIVESGELEQIPFKKKEGSIYNGGSDTLRNWVIKNALTVAENRQY